MSGKIKSDGSTASYYELPAGAKELQDLIAYKNMNGQMAEIFRAGYRYGQVEHSDKLRDINKILFYAQAEKERLIKYEMPWEKEVPAKQTSSEEFDEVKTFENAIEEYESKLPKAKPVCSVCDAEIEGRVFYLGNEPRCAKHSG